jgi:MoaA/NifB/PqqE/SkfB family radical SAM enzyme
LPVSRWEEIFIQAQNLGVSYILLAGGEPLMRPDILEKAANIKNILFPVFTNGVLLDEAYVDFFDKNRNLIPVISLEGGEAATDLRRGEGIFEKTAEAMLLLKKKRILFGVSITFTKENILDITQESFAKELHKKGTGILFYVEYVPSDGISEHLAPDAEARAVFEGRLNVLRRKTRMLVISFPGDEDFTEGCLAAGRGFVHINHTGGLEPCPFSPYSDTNVAELSLKDALASPFLKKVREEGMLKGEHKGGCMLWERRSEIERLLASE